MTGRWSVLRHDQAGMAYLWVLLAVVVLGLGLGRVLEVYHQQRQREKEAELLYVGEQYRQAIRSYYYSSPGMVKRYPSTLQDLLLDRRLLTVRRHIRQLYLDPITGSSEWGLVRSREGGIIGVYSPSTRQPIKVSGFHDASSDFELASDYRMWKFIFQIE